MALTEFSLIQQFFADATQKRQDVIVDIGDDCAVLSCPADSDIAISIDTLVSGIHFFPDVDPHTLGHKSLAVGLSDLAAMGATPAWFTLALTIPSLDEKWLSAFASGMAELADQHNIQLVGGDTTKGPLTISIQVHGLVKKGAQLQRNHAKSADKIYVTGTLGDAGAALQKRLASWQPEELSEKDWSFLNKRLEQPIPQVNISREIQPFVNAAIDISDGVLADLGHILEASGKGARIYLGNIPLSSSLQKLNKAKAWQLALSSGDDYELCFTVPAEHVQALETLNLDIQQIGEITDEQKIVLLDEQGQPSVLDITSKGYDHFV